MMKCFSGRENILSKEMHEVEEVAKHMTLVLEMKIASFDLDNKKSKPRADKSASVSFNVSPSDRKRSVINSNKDHDDAAEQGSRNEISRSDEDETNDDSSEMHIPENDEDVPVNSEDDLSNSNEKKCISCPIIQTIAIDMEHNTLDPISIVGLSLMIEEKAFLVRMEPCQPQESLLSTRKKPTGARLSYCSQQIFYDDRDDRRKWLSYSLSKDALYCIPCLLFTNASSRGELQRANQGHAFTCAGYSNCKKQYEAVAKH